MGIKAAGRLQGRGRNQLHNIVQLISSTAHMPNPTKVASSFQSSHEPGPPWMNTTAPDRDFRFEPKRTNRLQNRQTTKPPQMRQPPTRFEHPIDSIQTVAIRFGRI